MPPLIEDMISPVNTQHFVFFANASPTIGAGHIMRSMALAQACLKRGIKVSFASYECPEYLSDLLRKEGIAVISLPSTFTHNQLQALNASVFVIDDYCLSQEQWHYFKSTHSLLVNIDDNLNNDSLISDLIINPSSTATEKSYRKRAPQANFCLGPKYSLLRREFVEQSYIDIEHRNRILITLGGADTKNMSLALVQAILKKQFNDAEIHVLLGGLNSQSLKPLQLLANEHSHLFVIEKSQHVAELMMQSGLAITAAGGTLNELACLGTPSIALVSADNQKAALYPQLNPGQSRSWFCARDVRGYVANADEQTDVVRNAQIVEEVTSVAHELWRDLCKRKYMNTHARQLIDGLGCDRIVEQILQSL